MEIADLLQKTLEIINEIDTQRKKNGSYFNIFDILGVGHKEVRICMFLHELLSPKGSHGAGSIYLRAFVRDVLQIDETIFKDAEYDNAVVTKEELIDNDRRIDLLIRIGKRAFPIEAKIYAKDQDKQCIDYYNYSCKHYDKETVIHYLTIDEHMPSESSIGSLKVGKNLMLISFESHIINWLDNCVDLPETNKRPAVKELMSQFRDLLLRLTKKNRKEISMQLLKEINSTEKFIAARTIANEINEIKANKMKEVFEYIENYISDISGGKIAPVHKNYKERIATFYNHASTTWPTLCYLLKTHDPALNNKLILRIEVDYRLYYGVGNWDDEKKQHSKGTDDTVVQDYVESYAGDCFVSNSRTDWWYFWKYLGTDGHGINFRECDENFERLFDEDKFEVEMQEICKEIREFFYNWKMLDN